MNKLLAHDDKTRAQMLESIGLKQVDELFQVIPKEARMTELNLHEPKEDYEVQRELNDLARQNNINYKYFIGGGSYKHFTPSAINAVISRFEFLSAYTPYQAEISQGTLEVMYDFQTMICKLTNQDVSNASVYDGGSACAEAIFMAGRLTKKRKAFISKNINPNYLEVIKTYLWANDFEYTIGDEIDGCDYACHIYQTPNYYGEIEKMPKKCASELIIAVCNLTSLALIEPPKADITVGDFQTLGIPSAFGGPYGGFMACRDAYKRQLPGRIVGKSFDKDGKEAFVLTLQAREQHIRREKATSNICSNQALSALCANLYIELMGEDGFLHIAQKSFDNAHALASSLEKKGYKILSENFFDEFLMVVENPNEFLSRMQSNGILAGLKVGDNKVLVCTSELNTKEDILSYIENA